MRNKTTAGLLALVFGGIGIHKFYLGKSVQGFMYLFFCWTFLPMIIGFLEGLSYFSMSELQFQEKFNDDSVSGAPTTKTHVKCPDCRELVLKDARKCKHCGAALIPQT